MGLDELKGRIRDGWSTGDYTPISEMTRPVARVLVDECAISAGQEVLDVAAGDGNVALVAALEGASVTASDLTPAMVERGRARTDAEGVDVRWEVADVEELPFAGESFDTVTSAFGAMFAPQPRLAAEQMFRVLRPGGTLGLTTWPPESVVGRTFALAGRYMPPPEGLPRPTEWGVEEVVRERLDGLAGSLRVERRTVRWEFPSIDDYFRRTQSVGPTAAGEAGLSDEQREQLKTEFFELAAEYDRGDGSSVVIEPEYLLVVARKRG